MVWHDAAALVPMKLGPIKLEDIELSNRQDVNGLDRYLLVRGLVRLHGVPIGYVTVPLSDGCCDAATLDNLIVQEHADILIEHALRHEHFRALSIRHMVCSDRTYNSDITRSGARDH